jgi:uncharacterized protein YegJ (DUF2314 family)
VTTSDSDHKEPLFVYPKADHPELTAAHVRAKASLSDFAAAVNKPKARGGCYSVKVYFPDTNGSEGSHIWLAVNDLFGGMYFCSAKELPRDFQQLKLGETLILTNERIEDWMIIVGGVLYGGYSLRVLRGLVAPEERQRFDEHIGVTEYRDGMP